MEGPPQLFVPQAIENALIMRKQIMLAPLRLCFSGGEYDDSSAEERTWIKSHAMQKTHKCNAGTLKKASTSILCNLRTVWFSHSLPTPRRGPKRPALYADNEPATVSNLSISKTCLFFLLRASSGDEKGDCSCQLDHGASFRSDIVRACANSG